MPSTFHRPADRDIDNLDRRHIGLVTSDGEPGAARRDRRGTGRAFVGRDAELALVERVLADVQAGHRRLLVVEAEAGLGKTWFLDEVVARAARVGFTTAVGRCWPYGDAPELWPWQRIVGDVLGRGALRLLDTHDTATDDGLCHERFARFEAIAHQLASAAVDQPLLLAIDGADDAQPATLLLARFLTNALDGRPVAIVLTRRPSAAATDSTACDLFDDLIAEADVLSLPPFDRADIATLLRAYRRADDDAGHDDVVRDDDAEFIDTLLRLTSGRPLALDRAVSGATSSTTSIVDRAVAQAVDQLPALAQHLVVLAAIAGPDVTITDLAHVLGRPSSLVARLAAGAASHGLLVLSDDRCLLADDAIRHAVIAAVPAEERAAINALLAAHFADDRRPDWIVRRAAFGIASLPRADAAVTEAIEACERAAEVLRGRPDNVGAAAILADAVALAERALHRPPPARLVCALAQATLACGSLTHARGHFDRAAELARAEDDVIVLAQAALGLGGVWLNEHRSSVDRQRVLDLQRLAVSRLAEKETPLVARLTMRLAAEAVYDGAPAEPVWDALALVRTLGDDAALAEALSLTHHALLAPEHAACRLELAHELVRVATSAGDELLALFGLMWRTVDLYHLGDSRAERSLAELRLSARALGCRSVDYIVAVIDVMRLIRAGRLDEAESEATAALALGLEVGDADATAYYGTHVLVIRWMQGRDDELVEALDAMINSPTLAIGEWGLHAAAACIASRNGDATRAHALVDTICAGDLAQIRPSSTWLGLLTSLAETARSLGDRLLARDVYDALEVHASLPVLPSLAVACLGSTERSLGVAAIAMGEVELAVEHLERAVIRNEELANVPMRAIALADLAQALALLPEPDDRREAAVRYAQATDLATMLPLRAAVWRAAADDVNEAAGRLLTIEHGESGWRIGDGDHLVQLSDRVGLRYLHVLVDRAGTDVSATDLCGAALVDHADHHKVDRRALDAYRVRLRQLDAEIDDADRDADLGRAERLRLERDALVTEITRAVGLASRPRAFTDTGERARTAVTKAIKRAIDAIEAACPELGQHLRTAVTTGFTCRYQPM